MITLARSSSDAGVVYNRMVSTAAWIKNRPKGLILSYDLKSNDYSLSSDMRNPNDPKPE